MFRSTVKDWLGKISNLIGNSWFVERFDGVFVQLMMSLNETASLLVKV